MQRSCPFSTQLPSVLIIRPLKRNERIGRGQVSCKAIRPIDHHPSDVRHASLKSDEAVLCRLFRAHDAPITAAVIVEDSDSEQRLVTSSYDQNLVFWRLQQDGLDTNRLEAARFACGHPVLSLAGDSDRAKDGKRSVYCARTGGDNDIVCWDPPKSGFNPKVCLGPHGGWVRDLQSYKKWMFSCDCNTLRQWDLTWTNPRHLRDVSLFKGDILSIAVGDYKVFVGVNDGTIHSWTITDNGELLPSQSIVAHKGRINSIAYGHGVLYSGGDDGHLKVNHVFFVLFATFSVFSHGMGTPSKIFQPIMKPTTERRLIA